MDVMELLHLAYEPLIAFADGVDEDTGWTPTALPGWTTRDLLWHLNSDCQRALVALHTPVTDAPDTDEVSYWSHWEPGTDGAQSGLRGTRIMASAWTSVRGPAALYAESARAVLVAAGRADLDAVVATQGHRLTATALLHTLVVEAAVHRLDLEPVVPTPPPAPVLAEVRRVLTALLGAPLPPAWSDVHAARAGTGRAPLTDTDRSGLGDLATRFPLFG